jgi:SOS response regulatory protein OraA/RecX
MGKFRIRKDKLDIVLEQVITEGLISEKDYAKRFNHSTSYVGDLFAEIRRALKRGDMTTTPEAMEHFLRSSSREAKMLY